MSPNATTVARGSTTHGSSWTRSRRSPTSPRTPGSPTGSWRRCRSSCRPTWPRATPCALAPAVAAGPGRGRGARHLHRRPAHRRHGLAGQSRRRRHLRHRPARRPAPGAGRRRGARPGRLAARRLGRRGAPGLGACSGSPCSCLGFLGDGGRYHCWHFGGWRRLRRGEPRMRSPLRAAHRTRGRAAPLRPRGAGEQRAPTSARPSSARQGRADQRTSPRGQRRRPARAPSLPAPTVKGTDRRPRPGRRRRHRRRLGREPRRRRHRPSAAVTSPAMRSSVGGRVLADSGIVDGEIRAMSSLPSSSIASARASADTRLRAERTFAAVKVVAGSFARAAHHRDRRAALRRPQPRRGRRRPSSSRFARAFWVGLAGQLLILPGARRARASRSRSRSSASCSSRSPSSRTPSPSPAS